MEEREVGYRLQNLDNKTRDVFNRGLNFEQNEFNTTIRNRLRDIEYVLNGYRVDTPRNIDQMIVNLKNKLGEISIAIEDSRDQEKRSTIENLESVSIKLEDAIKELEEFETEGIRPTGQDDSSFEKTVEKIVQRETESFIKDNGISDDRAVDEVKDYMIRIKDSVVRTHDTVSVDMKHTIKKEVREVGEEFLARKEQEQTKQPENSFASKLQSGRVSDDEIARKDAVELSNNEAAFVGNNEQRTTTKADLEAMFK